MTSRERAELKTRAMQIESIFQIGKSGLSPSQVDAVRAALETRELIKIHVLKNCGEDPRELAEILAERTGSQVVQVIGRKIVLYRRKRESGARNGKAPGAAKTAGAARAGQRGKTARRGRAAAARSAGQRSTAAGGKGKPGGRSEGRGAARGADGRNLRRGAGSRVRHG